MSKHKDENGKPLHINNIPVKLKNEFKAKCAQEGKSMQNKIADLVKEFIVDDKNGFIAGVGYSAALIFKAYDDHAGAEFIINESGLKKKDFKKCCDKHDFDIIKEVL